MTARDFSQSVSPGTVQSAPRIKLGDAFSSTLSTAFLASSTEPVAMRRSKPPKIGRPKRCCTSFRLRVEPSEKFKGTQTLVGIVNQARSLTSETKKEPSLIRVRALIHDYRNDFALLSLTVICHLSFLSRMRKRPSSSLSMCPRFTHWFNIPDVPSSSLLLASRILTAS